MGSDPSTCEFAISVAAEFDGAQLEGTMMAALIAEASVAPGSGSTQNVAPIDPTKIWSPDPGLNQ